MKWILALCLWSIGQVALGGEVKASQAPGTSDRVDSKKTALKKKKTDNGSKPKNKSQPGDLLPYGASAGMLGLALLNDHKRRGEVRGLSQKLETSRGEERQSRQEKETVDRALHEKNQELENKNSELEKKERDLEATHRDLQRQTAEKEARERDLQARQAELAASRLAQGMLSQDLGMRQLELNTAQSDLRAMTDLKNSAQADLFAKEQEIKVHVEQREKLQKQLEGSERSLNTTQNLLEREKALHKEASEKATAAEKKVSEEIQAKKKELASQAASWEYREKTYERRIHVDAHRMRKFRAFVEKTISPKIGPVEAKKAIGPVRTVVSDYPKSASEINLENFSVNFFLTDDCNVEKLQKNISDYAETKIPVSVWSEKGDYKLLEGLDKKSSVKVHSKKEFENLLQRSFWGAETSIIPSRAKIYFLAMRAALDFVTKDQKNIFVFSRENSPALSREELFDDETLKNLRETGLVLGAAKNGLYFGDDFFMLSQHQNMVSSLEDIFINTGRKRVDFLQKAGEEIPEHVFWGTFPRLFASFYQKQGLGFLKYQGRDYDLDGDDPDSVFGADRAPSIRSLLNSQFRRIDRSIRPGNQPGPFQFPLKKVFSKDQDLKGSDDVFEKLENTPKFLREEWDDFKKSLREDYFVKWSWIQESVEDLKEKTLSQGDLSSFAEKVESRSEKNDFVQLKSKEMLWKYFWLSKFMKELEETKEAENAKVEDVFFYIRDTDQMIRIYDTESHDSFLAEDNERWFQESFTSDSVSENVKKIDYDKDLELIPDDAIARRVVVFRKNVKCKKLTDENTEKKEILRKLRTKLKEKFGSYSFKIEGGLDPETEALVVWPKP